MRLLFKLLIVAVSFVIYTVLIAIIDIKYGYGAEH